MNLEAGQVWRRPDGVLFEIEAIDGKDAHVYARCCYPAPVNVCRAATPAIIPVLVIEQGWRKLDEPELVNRGT